MKKELPLSKPIIDCYSKLGMIFSILGLYSETRTWLLYNYLQLVYYYDIKSNISWIDLCNYISPIYAHEWESCPFIITYGISYEKFIEYDIKKMIIDSINNEEYIYINLNTKYIKDYNQKEDFFHDALISGYDLDNDSILCSDYFGIKYQKKWIDFQDIKNGIIFNEDAKYINVLEKIIFLKYRKPIVFPYYYIGRVDNVALKNNLKRLLYPDNNYKDFFNIRSGSECYMGLSVYDNFIRKIKEGVVDITDNRPFCAIRDHIIILAHITELLNQYDAIVLDELKKLAEKMCNMSLKTIILLENHKKIEKQVNIEKLSIIIETIKIKEENYIKEILKH